MKTREFDFELPRELIAQAPPGRREDARLMAVDRATGRWEHRRFPELDGYLRAGDLLVLNDTRVVPARITLWRETGGRVDALLVRRKPQRRDEAATTQEGQGEPRRRNETATAQEGRECRWEALLDTPRKLAAGDRLKVRDREWARIDGKTEDGKWLLVFDREPDLAALGRAPLPPYIRREADAADLGRYQTVYAVKDGAIAAPTAGLHFTAEHIERLKARGVTVATVTLHVGIGTFKPVKAEEIADHRMDPEWYDVPAETASALAKASRVVAVGTTSCRTIESFARSGQSSGWTDLFITPGFEFRRVNALLTNFHVPKSTLVMLVAAFAGLERVKAAYAEAVRERYRFFSYGDAMLLI